MRPPPRLPIPADQERRWQEENEAAIASINFFIDRYGLLASKLRYRPDRDSSGVR